MFLTLEKGRNKMLTGKNLCYNSAKKKKKKKKFIVRENERKRETERKINVAAGVSQK